MMSEAGALTLLKQTSAAAATAAAHQEQSLLNRSMLQICIELLWRIGKDCVFVSASAAACIAKDAQMQSVRLKNLNDILVALKINTPTH